MTLEEIAGLLDEPLRTCLWLAALAANGQPVAFDASDLEEQMIELMRFRRPSAKA